jgi:hypothetical protein
MSRIKDYYYDKILEKDQSDLADLLGISTTDLSRANYHVEADTSNDDMMIYGYTVYFDEDTPKDILNKIKGLNDKNQVWLGPGMYDEYNEGNEEEFLNIINNKDFYSNLLKELEYVSQLNELDLENMELNSILKRQLFITSIGALETFLSETFINLTIDNPDYFRNFIETFPKFKQRKLELSDIFKEYDLLRKTAKDEMLGIIYHNLGQIKLMFSSTFKIDFPSIETLSKAVNTRHDLVHRSGKTKENVEVDIDKKQIDDLLTAISSFTEDLSKRLNINT